MMVKCEICGEYLLNFQKLSNHIKKHKVSSEKYYRTHIMSEKTHTGVCKCCGAEKTKFRGLNKGYRPFCSSKKCRYGLTEKKCIIRHGLSQGKKVWEEYCRKQANSNSFEYKQNRYGWTEQQYHDYNQNRANTKDNFIKRYGQKMGEQKWEKYCKTQSIVGVSEEYFIEKYGRKKGIEKFKQLNKSKKHTISSYVKKYGRKKGIEKFKQLIDKRRCFGGYSKISQLLFREIDKEIKNTHLSYYFEKNKEYGRMDVENNTYYFVDYCIPHLKKIVEFNGVRFHVKEGQEKGWFNPYNENITVEQQKQKDKQKQKFFQNIGFKILYIWEDEYKLDPRNEVNKCTRFLTT